MTPAPNQGPEAAAASASAGVDGDRIDDDGSHWIDEAILKVPYIPDFRVDDLRFFFVPDRVNAREAYHSLPAAVLDRWATYLTKKGDRFLRAPADGADGPFRVRPGKTRIEILEPGRLFSPKAQICVPPNFDDVPIVSLQKKRPFDEWKPNYIKALNFVKKYRFTTPVSRAVEYAVWEVEECGEVAGSVSWENAERILQERADDNEPVQTLLADLFEKRPEEFPLGSEVYLRVLGCSGDAGVRRLCDLHTHPQFAKRCHVARALGQLGSAAGLDVLVSLLDDEDPEVREAALQAMGKAGVPRGHESEERIRGLLDAEELSLRVWAAEALLRGGDERQEKTLVQLVKESPLPLIDMGELGKILIDLKMVQTVPFLIKRLKSERVELRDDAAETLRGLTGLDVEFRAHDDAEIRRAAVRQWDRWWEDYKRNKGRKKR